jgi:hypothetical protein
MPITFLAGNQLHNPNFKNRRAAQRQTEAERSRIFAKYQSLVGTMFKNSLAARRAANAELNNPSLHPEYWDDDTTPRLPLSLTSSCFAQVTPMAGGVMLYFRSNPSKGYFYPSGGTKAETAKRVYDLLSSPSLGQAYHSYWGAQNGAKKVTSKSGKSYSYKMKGGKTLDIKAFDRMGARYAKV